MDPRTEKMLAERAEAAAKLPRPLREGIRIRDQVRAWVRVHKPHAILISTAMVATLVAGYYTMVVLPAAERDRTELETRSAERLKSSTASRQNAVDACLEKAKTDAEAEWVNACKARRQRAGCALPRGVVEEQRRRESAARNACLIIPAS